MKGMAVYVTFAGPGTVQGNHVKIIIINIKGKRKSLFDIECFAAIIFDFYRADDGIKLFKNCIYNSNFCIKNIISGGKFEDRALIC